MDCEYLPTLSLVEFGERLRKAPAPLGGGIELTHRCNLGCIHCYNRKKAGDRAARDAEMSYDTICRIVDQAAEMGCFSLYLTGGEPLLRRDFLDIYGYVISKGILTVLFTNATLITPRIADHLAEYPPLFVDISLYGRTKDVYESITGVPGSFERCMRGIELLAERGLPFNLKTPAMIQNKGELESLAEFAKSLDSDFRFDVLLHPRLHDRDNRYAPYDYSLPLEERAELEFVDPERVEAWQAYRERAKTLTPQNTVYRCGAGMYGFFVDANGRLGMCVLSREPSYDLTQGTFQEGWAALTSVRGRERHEEENGHGCGDCEITAFCPQCAARSQLEYGPGVSTRRVDWICELTHLRMRKLKMLKGAKG
jgi:radical SAM protein with 4Fe4S-binding SPASM domain